MYNQFIGSLLRNEGYFLNKIVGKLLPLDHSYPNKNEINEELLTYIKESVGIVNSEYYNLKLSQLFEIATRTFQKRQLSQFYQKYELIKTEHILIQSTVLTSLICKAFYRKTQINTKTISASDIGQYTFCPVSFAIHRTFDIPANINMKSGSKLHDQLRLLNRFDRAANTFNVENSCIDNSNLAFFKKINSSKFVYAGHAEDSQPKFFRKGDFVCQPDYIFLDDENKYFIVEEKFSTNVENLSSNFSYRNHWLQLCSYIYGIEEFNIEYGYIVNWTYEYQDNKPHNVACRTNKVTRQELSRFELQNTYKQIKAFVERGDVEYDTSAIETNKCMKCSVAGICHHKYKKADLKFISIPYLHKWNQTEIPIPNRLQPYIANIDFFLDDSLKCCACKFHFKYDQLSIRYANCHIVDKTTYNYSIIHESSHGPNIVYPAIARNEDGTPSHSDFISKIPFVCNDCYQTKRQWQQQH